jgi:uncharacterized protein (TIGR02118 family)
MARILAMYTKPADAAAWDEHYYNHHIPLAKKVPGLRRLELSRGEITSPLGPVPYHLIGSLYFDSVAAAQAGFASPEGQAAAADAASFMQPGDMLLLVDDHDV